MSLQSAARTPPPPARRSSSTLSVLFAVLASAADRLPSGGPSIAALSARDISETRVRVSTRSSFSFVEISSGDFSSASAHSSSPRETRSLSSPGVGAGVVLASRANAAAHAAFASNLTFASGEGSRSVARSTAVARPCANMTSRLTSSWARSARHRTAAMTTSGREDGSDAAAANVASASWPSRNTAARVLRAAGLRVGSICLCKSSSARRRTSRASCDSRAAMSGAGGGLAASTIAGKSRVGARLSRRSPVAERCVSAVAAAKRARSVSSGSTGSRRRRIEHSSRGAPAVTSWRRASGQDEVLANSEATEERSSRSPLRSALTAATATSSLDSLARSDLSFRAISQRNIAASPRVSVIAFPGARRSWSTRGATACLMSSGSFTKRDTAVGLEVFGSSPPPPSSPPFAIGV